MASFFNVLSGDNKGLRWLIGGVLLGTAGVRILTSNDARKVYVQGTAAALRGKEEVMTTATTLRENCEDIYAEAVEINEKRMEDASKETVIEDRSKATAKTGTSSRSGSASGSKMASKSKAKTSK